MRIVFAVLTVGALFGVLLGVALNLSDAGQNLAAILLLLTVGFFLAVSGSKKAGK